MSPTDYRRLYWFLLRVVLRVFFTRKMYERLLLHPRHHFNNEHNVVPWPYELPSPSYLRKLQHSLRWASWLGVQLTVSLHSPMPLVQGVLVHAQLD